MRVVRAIICWVLLGALGAVCPGWAEETSVRVAAALDATTVMRSGDGVFVVGGSVTIPRTVRQEMMQYCTVVRGRVASRTGLKLSRRRGAFVIWLEDAPDAEPGVFSSFRRERGGWRRQLTVRNPGQVDLSEMQARFCGLVLGGWILDRAGTAGNDGPGLPVWLAVGMGRYLEKRRRQSDNEAVLASWSSAALAPVWELLAHSGGPADAEPALAGMLVAWMLNQPERDDRFRALFERLALGKPWDVASVGEVMFGSGEPTELNDTWDNWLLGRRSYVGTPGTTPPRIAANLRRQLLIYPGDFGMPLGLGSGHGVSPARLVAFAEEPWVPMVVTHKSAALRLGVAGRGPEVMQVVAAYERLFDALRRQEPTDRVQARLKQAQKLLSTYEAKQRVSAP